MKSRRVTKLLACVLATSMCTVPVAASSTSKTLTSNVTLNNPSVQATFPTALNLQINPMADSNQTGISLNRDVASKELVIANSTSKNGVYYGLLCTATAQLTTVGEGVQLNYRSFNSDADSTVKKVHLDLVAADENASNATQSSNNTYSGTGGETVITKLKSQLQFTISAPDANSPTVSGAFAVVGDANGNADWQTNDLSLSIVYNVKPIGSSFSIERTIPSLNSAASSATKLGVDNASSTDFTIVDDELPATIMKDATVTHVQVHSPENIFADVLIPADDARLVIDYEDDTNNPDFHECKVAFAKDSTFLKNLAKNQEGKTFDVLVILSDGRRLVSKIAVEKSQN